MRESLKNLRRLLPLAFLLAGTASARASIAYGSINNFDTVNDTGHECHGFEIEIEDCPSTGITYTYNYNHYGVPNITEDNSVAGHPKCVIRWASKKNTEGTWASYTAIPSGPISPTQGHSFTNPAVNFGGEHFGVGYYAAVGPIHYNWLIDDGSGNLIHGGVVQVATPSFTYYPPAVGVPAQVQAVIAPPPPEAPEPKEFGKAVWMKEIRTVSHNNQKVALRELVSEDADHPEKKDWKNGEADEVETEWQLLQKDYGAADGGQNGKKPAQAEDLPGGDEVVTRRYEFYKYTGPLDNETGEAMADNVDADGIHGSGIKTVNGVEVDLSTLEVVGEYTGAQMAAVDVDAGVGLIDHVGEGKVNTSFAARKIVVQGSLPFSCTMDGPLPAGMSFNEVTGVLSGTPTTSGQFQFKVTASDGFNDDVVKNYTLSIAPALANLPPSYLVDSTVAPVGAGTTTGDGSFAPGAEVTVNATANAGYRFLNWTDNGTAVSSVSGYTFILDVNHSLVANFGLDVPQWNISGSALPEAGGSVTGAGIVDDAATVTLVASPNAGFGFTNWTEGGLQVSTSATYAFNATSDRALVANFAPLPTYTVSASASPVAGGTVSGGGSFLSGSSVTVTATPSAGYFFVKWSAGGTQLSSSPSYTFNVNSNKALVATFLVTGTAKTITTSSTPAEWGTATGGGTYGAGDSVTVVAVANPHYKFLRWLEGNSNVSDSEAYTFTVTNNRTLKAKFVEDFVINASAVPVVGGTTEVDSASYQTGDNARVKAFPEFGYTFTNWTENGTIVSTNTTYSFNVTGPRTLVAHFKMDNGVTITTAATPADGGAVTGDGGYEIDGQVTVSATANPGFVFAGWYDVGEVEPASWDPVFTFWAAQDRDLEAHFVQAVTITASSIPAFGGVVLGDGEYPAGSIASVEAFAEADFVFRNWTEDGAIVSTEPAYSFTVEAARTLVANFSPSYTITGSAQPVGGGEVLGAGQVTPGQNITLVASATVGYSFVNWTDSNGVEVSTNPSFTFAPISSGEFTANFSTVLAGVHFNFDSGLPELALHATMPFSQTVGGLTASFSSPNGAPPTIETEASSGKILANFAAHFIAPSASQGTVIDVQFDQSVTGVSFNFSTVEDPGVVVGSNLLLTAIDNSGGTPVVVGSALGHGTALAGDSHPTGLLMFNSGTPFDSIRIELANFPNGAPQFMMDNLIVSPLGSTGGSMLLANPHWNITLSDFGYSDYLLDNTPGFEGREYLSGEWATAVAYTRNGVDVQPTWLDPNFLYPDWRSNSTFRVVSGIHLVGSNLDGLPIAESIIANDDLEITLHFEMLDTVTGTPMGTSAAGTGGAGGSVDSNRYVLNESYRVRNVSGVAITNIQIFQMIHGLISQRGVYDNRAYVGKLSQYRYDTTLAGIDANAVGSGSSTAGLEDYICFHSKVAPTAFEIGHYGIDGNGIDNHFDGKPSDGVHLSIEANWQGAPYDVRQGRDYFAPSDRWVAGGQRWSVGNLAAGQFTSIDILLSLLTGTKVTAVVDPGGGHHGGGSCNGGSSHVGGVDFDIDDVTAEGTFFGDYAEADEDEMFERENSGEFAMPNFNEPNVASTQIWHLEYNGAHSGLIHLKFAYNPVLLPAGTDEGHLVIYHYNGTIWEKLTGTVDTVAHTLSVSTTSLSPFVLGLSQPVDPVITTHALPAMGGTIVGDGVHVAGSLVNLQAMPSLGYDFVNWTEGGVILGTEPGLSFTMGSVSRTLEANFIPAGHLITVTSTSANGGTVTGGGHYVDATTVTLSAVPSVDWEFAGWWDGVTLVSLSPTYAFNAVGPLTLTASFLPNLTIQSSAESNQMTVSWPASADGWVLMESTDLITWTASTDAVTNSLDRKSVKPASKERCFFILQHP